MTTSKAERLVYQFEVAVGARDDLGAIPIYSGDREEQIAIDAERFRIKRNYTRTRNKLIKALGDLT